MKVTVCQIDPRADQIVQYLSDLKTHISDQGTDFLLLPEMGFSDWLAADRDVSEARWKKAVKDHETHISNLENFGVTAVMGTRPLVNTAGSRRNEAYIWTKESSEAVGFHQKYYLPDEDGYWEHSWYDRGPKQFDAARALGMRLGVQICTEMWFLEWARHYAASRIDLLCVPRATPHGTTDKWLAGGQTAAVCSGAYCLSSNLFVPEGDGPSLGGLGWIIDPEGEVLATTSPDNPIVTANIDLEFARESKTTYPRYVPE